MTTGQRIFTIGWRIRSMFVAAGSKHEYSTPSLSAGQRTAARFQKAIS